MVRLSLVRLSALVALFVPACSNDVVGGGDASADPDAAVMPLEMGFLACESSSTLDSAAVEAIVPGTHRRVTTTGFSLDPDCAIRRLVDKHGAEHLYTVHRTQGVVVERDRTGAQVHRFDVNEPGAQPGQTDPWDVAFGPDDNLWITRFGSKSLLLLKGLDPGIGTTVATVDLSAFADADGRPDMSAIAFVGETALVALERLDHGFEPKNTATVVAIDVNSRQPAAFLDLPRKTPQGRFTVAPDGSLYLPCIGGPLSNPPNAEAGIVRIDVDRKSATVVLDATATDVPTFPTSVSVVDAHTAYATVAELAGDNPTRVVRFDPTTGKVADTYAKTAGYLLWQVEAAQDQLFVADRSTSAPGVRVLQRSDGVRVGFVPTRLPPTELVVMRAPDSP